MNAPAIPANAPVAPATARLQRLLGSGYFPSELPPPFTTTKFAMHAPGFARRWSGKEIRKFRTSAEHYSIPRWGQVRRKLCLVNPINQLHVADLISSNWSEISQRLQRSKISEFHPRILPSGSGRAVNGVDFDAVSRRKAEILSRYGRYAKTDITRFYPSIYTHSIAWALLGKEWVKDHIQTSAFKNSFANRIDQAVSAGQGGQTVGIPIGPDTSRILSELIATEIEELARSEISDFDHRCVRYVDDMIIGLEEQETADFVIAKLSAALYEFELELNGEKTLLHGLGCPHSPEWLHFIRCFELANAVRRQREDLDSFFEQSIHLADANTRDSVLLFATKRAASFKIKDDNWGHYVRWMLYLARRSAGCLSFVVEHLAAAAADGRGLPLADVSDFIRRQIILKADAAHTAEVAWLIFFARELELDLDATVLERVVHLRSSVCALLMLDLRQRGQIAGRISTSHWRSFGDSAGLESEMWLVAYEATKKGWWPRTVSSNYVQQHKFFGDLWAKDVSFYDPSRRAQSRVSPSPLSIIRSETEGGLDPFALGYS